MPGTALLCTDGSDLSVAALAAGRAVVDPGLTPVLVTVIEPSDPSLVTGTGFAAGVLSPEELAAEDEARTAEATATLADVATRLGLAAAEQRIVVGAPGPAICDAATETAAAVVVIGSRGRGGLKRAVLGSVSDHVVRHAPCPVLVTAPDSP
jgi:nucleotide-binding universal stress UspA family protein